MTRAEIFEKLNDVFRDVFDDDSIIVVDETTAADIDDWDSLEHITLMVSIEEAFGMEFNMAEVTGLKNVGEMVDVIMNRLG